MHDLPDRQSFDASRGPEQDLPADVAGRIATLRYSSLCRGLSVEALHDLAVAVRPVHFRAGEVVCQQEDPGGSMFLVAHGRVKLTIARGPGSYRLLDYLGRGDHFGDMSMLTGRHRLATATAVVDSDLLELKNEDFQRLLETAPAFGANLSRTMGFRLQMITQGGPVRWQPKVVGLVNSTLRTQSLIYPLAAALATDEESLEVLTDRAEVWRSDHPYSVAQLPEPAAFAQDSREEDQIRRSVQRSGRVLIDMTQRGLETELPRRLRHCEQVWWLVEPRFAETSLANLRTLLAADRSLAGRIHLVWILSESERFAPLWDPALLGVDPLDFKVPLGGGSTPSVAQRQGISRLVRHLQGTRVGLALSGGGGRGLAHLGVLRALERAGIDFDLMAGASSGAMTGISYAAGWPPNEALELFKRDVTPHWLFRGLPRGAQWYLCAMYRTGAWDRKLRAYAGDAQLQQLQIPFSTVAVDLVGGKQVVRDRGDVVHSILESINLPVISAPILRDGMALVDGGILNNLPGDVLPERGASLVVGVDVVARLPKRFAERVRRKEGGYRTPRVLETLLRVNEVQDYGITAMRAPAIDLIIAPDTSAFEFADFTRGHQLAEVGEAAAEEAIPQLRQMIAEMAKKK